MDERTDDPAAAAPPYDRRHVFAAACFGALVFGIVMTVLGSILPELVERFGVGRAAAGFAITLLSLGVVAGSLIFGPIVDRYGYKGLLLSCTFLVFAGIEALALAPSFDLLRVAVFVIGVGGGVLNGGTNALVSDISVEGRSAGLSLYGAFFGVGAFGVPFLLGFLLETYSYTILTAFIGAPVLISLFYFSTLAYPRPKQPQGVPPAQAAALMRDPVLLLLGALLFLQSGIEITTSGWTTSYFQEELGVAPGSAAFALSLFWVAMAAARIAMGRMLGRMRPARVLRIGLGIALVGSILLAAAPAPVVAYAGIGLMGLGLSAGFPIALGYAGDLYPGMSGTAFSILFVIALTGGSVLPYVAALLGASYGLRAAFLIPPVAVALMTLVLIPAVRHIRARMAA